MPTNTLVHKHQSGVYRIGETKVSLDSIVYAYLDGASPEEIAERFPALSAEEVQGAIAFYLANRQEVHEYLKQQDAVWEAARRESEATPNPAWDRLRAIKQERQ